MLGRSEPAPFPWNGTNVAPRSSVKNRCPIDSGINSPRSPRTHDELEQRYTSPGCLPAGVVAGNAIDEARAIVAVPTPSCEADVVQVVPASEVTAQRPSLSVIP